CNGEWLVVLFMSEASGLSLPGVSARMNSGTGSSSSSGTSKIATQHRPTSFVFGFGGVFSIASIISGSILSSVTTILRPRPGRSSRFIVHLPRRLQRAEISATVGRASSGSFRRPHSVNQQRGARHLLAAGEQRHLVLSRLRDRHGELMEREN